MAGTASEATQTARLFIGLWPDPAMRDALAAWGEQWQWNAGAKRVRAERLHLTLHFLGDVPRTLLPALKPALEVPVAPFSLSLGRAAVWRGGIAVLESLKKQLGIDVGGTTEDRLFSLEVGRCFGACGLAPVIMVDDDVHHRVKPKRIGAVLDHYREPAVAERSA